MRKSRLVLFDIDGTLLHSGGAGRRAIVTALGEQLGDAGAFDRVRFDGKTDPQILAELFAEAGHSEPPEAGRIAELCQAYVALLEAELARTGHLSRMLPGVADLLDRLEEERGVLLGLLTGNLQAGAALKLRAAGIDPARFQVGAYGSDAAHRPDLPPIAVQRAASWFGREPAGAEVIILGDTPADVTCGRCVQARAVAVATGSYTVDDLREAGAYAVFQDLTDTGAVLRAILED